MKLTNKQKIDLETILYFIPENMKTIKITDSDIQKFFEFSDEGKHKEEKKQRWGNTWFDVLVQGKVWRWRHMQMYEDGILDGSMPYFILLWWLSKKRKWYQFWKSKYYNEPIPRSVVDFMKKEMFKWHDVEVIERVYKLLSE